MADTFTPNYNLTKPQIGGDSNTWGGLLNANFDTIDTAIKGVSDVAYGALHGVAGIIVLWSGAIAAIPAKWKLCDGTNGTPDLRDRFIVGSGGAYAQYQTGGNATNTLSVAQLPSHNHGINDPGHGHAVSDPGHSHGIFDPGHSHGAPGGSTFFVNSPGLGNYAGGGSSFTTVTQTAGAATGINILGNVTGIGIFGTTTGVSVQNTGSGAAVENRPPFYALAYIMYTG